MSDVFFNPATSRLGRYMQQVQAAAWIAPVPPASPIPGAPDAWYPSAVAPAPWAPPAPPLAWQPAPAPVAQPRPKPPRPDRKPAAPGRPAAIDRPLDVGPIKDLTWHKAVALVKAQGGELFPKGRPTVLAIRTGRSPVGNRWQDHFVVLRPDGQLRAFEGNTRPNRASGAMLMPGNYEMTPRWKDHKWRNAFIVNNASGGLSVAVARDRNGDGRYSGSELTSPSTSSYIRLHPGSPRGGPASSGCLNVRDYDAFIRYLGGTGVRFDLTLIEA